ncbi:MAG: spondin domain-containing protein [Gammaproteobacteria bacterium]|nr:spondin domain-containing protein [Gammaproteobacteria bacterium]
MKSKLIAVAALGLTLTLLMPEAARSDGGKIYKVTITNLTAGQPLTPPILATHTTRTGFFTVGEPASEAIRQIAENGNGAVLLQALGADTQVHEVVTGAAPLVPANNPGNTGFESSATFTITAQGRARYLSYASMLICTNDGFTGLDSVRLPKHKTTFYAAGYDARTEANTEDFADIVPPCQGLIGVSSDDAGTGMSNPLLAEDGIVIPHAGINGGSDLLPKAHGWSDPVAKIEIERIRDYDD